MIAAIKGTVWELSPAEVHIETGSGVYYKIQIPVSDFSRLKKGAEALLHLVLKVKDEDIFLYGFLDEKKKELFEKLISVSGIGAKIALSCLSAFSVSDIIEAINRGDVGKISSTPGIGKKTAQRIILELTGKLEFAAEEMDEKVKMRDDLISALVNLGFPAKAVKITVEDILRDVEVVPGFEELFKLTLRKVSK